MNEKNRENLAMKGEPLKRYRLSYGWNVLEPYATAKEAQDSLTKDYQAARSILDRRRKWRYKIRDGAKEISLAELVRRAKEEEAASAP
jgi:hypothetical protein